MHSVRLVLAERNSALKRVLEAGLALYGFEVLTVPSVSAAAKATAQEDVHAVLLDAGLLCGALPEIDARITSIVMGEEAPLDGVALWIRKPFSPKLLAAFLLRRYRRVAVAHNRRSHYRRIACGEAEIVFEGAKETARGELINISDRGCCVALTDPVVSRERLRMMLRQDDRARLCDGVVRSQRLILTHEGELRLALGIEILRSAPIS